MVCTWCTNAMGVRVPCCAPTLSWKGLPCWKFFAVSWMLMLNRSPVQCTHARHGRGCHCCLTTQRPRVLRMALCAILCAALLVRRQHA